MPVISTKKRMKLKIIVIRNRSFQNYLCKNEIQSNYIIVWFDFGGRVLVLTGCHGIFCHFNAIWG